MDKAPDAFRTISEVAAWLATPAHVLRFWESRFAQIRPVKRAGGRRYYRRADMALLGGIKILLHERGLSIRAVQKMITDEGAAAVAALAVLPDEMVDEDDTAEAARGGGEAVGEAVDRDIAEAVAEAPEAAPEPPPEATAPEPGPAAAPALSPDLAPAPSPDLAPAPSPDLAPAPSPDLAPAPSPDLAPALSPDLAPALSPDLSPAQGCLPLDEPATIRPTTAPPAAAADTPTLAARLRHHGLAGGADAKALAALAGRLSALRERAAAAAGRGPTAR